MFNKGGGDIITHTDTLVSWFLAEPMSFCASSRALWPLMFTSEGPADVSSGRSAPGERSSHALARVVHEVL